MSFGSIGLCLKTFVFLVMHLEPKSVLAVELETSTIADRPQASVAYTEIVLWGLFKYRCLNPCLLLLTSVVVLAPVCTSGLVSSWICK